MTKKISEGNLHFFKKQIILFNMKILFLFFSLFVSPDAFAQSTQYINTIDQDLMIKSATVAPIPDNVSGIYSKSVSPLSKELIEFDQQWTLVEYPQNIKTTPEEYDENPELVKNILRKLKTDALVTGRISKGPKGIAIRVTIFSGKDGLPVASESLSEYGGFETSDINDQFQNVFRRAKAKIPYAARILSRKGSLVTLNLGSTSGVRPGQDITIVQILKYTRHPKFKFIVNSEMTIMGTIKIDKVDDYLSFGTILSERDQNVIHADSLVRRDQFVVYPFLGKNLNPLAQRPEKDVAFGENPKEWNPEEPPTFGRASFLFGLGPYTVSNNLSTGSVDGRSNLAPSIHILGEMWLTTKWFAGLELRQHLLKIENNLSESTPKTLGVSTLESGLHFGYNFLVHDSFWGPKFQITGGYAKMSSFVDQSTPTAFNSMDFSGMTIGVAGSFPIALESKNPFSLGGGLTYFFWKPTVNESPTSSGSGTANISKFSAFGVYRYSQRIAFRGELLFGLYGASFNNTGADRNPPASSASHQYNTLAFGIDYMM